MAAIYLDDRSRESQFIKALMEPNAGVGRLIAAHGGGTLKSSMELQIPSDSQDDEEEED